MLIEVTERVFATSGIEAVTLREIQQSFFFQAEDGIRYATVTGVQTCALPIFPIALMASNYLPQVGQIAERHPGLKLIIDHYARVRDGKDDAAHGNQPALLALAKYPNVAVKATGAPGNSSQPYPYRNIHKYTQQIVEAFGPERTFWGTDITRMPCSWKECVTMFTEEMPWLKGRDLELVMGRAVCDWLGWKLPG